MTINVQIAVTGCPADKAAEVVTVNDAGFETQVAVLTSHKLHGNIIYNGQRLLVREIDKPTELA